MSLIDNFVQNHVDLLKRNDYIDPSLYKELGVKSGLRNEDGKGVLAGLTNISQIISEKNVEQFVLHGPRRNFGRFGYLFDDDGGHGLVERLASRRRKPAVYKYDGRYSRTRQRLV